MVVQPPTVGMIAVYVQKNLVGDDGPRVNGRLLTDILTASDVIISIISGYLRRLIVAVSSPLLMEVPYLHDVYKQTEE